MASLDNANNMITYLLQVAICWALFLGLYHATLRKETFFMVNRTYLLLTLVLGLVIPRITWDTSMFMEQPTIEVAVDYMSHGFEEMTQVFIPTTSTILEAEESTNPMGLLASIYWLGVAFMIGKLIWGISRIIRIRRRSKLKIIDNQTIAYTDYDHAPFTFFGTVYLSEGRNDQYNDPAILVHEAAHVSGWHTIDVLFVELVKAFFWFNPLVYGYDRALKTVHEYIADANVLQRTALQRYGRLLLRQAQPGLEIALANHFYRNQLKTRLNMMTRTPSQKRMLFKYLSVLPFILVVSLVFTNQQVQAEIGKVEEMEIKDLAISPNGVEEFFKELAPITDGEKYTAEKYIEDLKAIHNTYNNTTGTRGDKLWAICSDLNQILSKATTLQTIPDYPAGERVKSNQSIILLSAQTNKTRFDFTLIENRKDPFSMIITAGSNFCSRLNSSRPSQVEPLNLVKRYKASNGTTGYHRYAEINEDLHRLLNTVSLEEKITLAAEINSYAIQLGTDLTAQVIGTGQFGIGFKYMGGVNYIYPEKKLVFDLSKDPVTINGETVRSAREAGEDFNKILGIKTKTPPAITSESYKYFLDNTHPSKIKTPTTFERLQFKNAFRKLMRYRKTAGDLETADKIKTLYNVHLSKSEDKKILQTFFNGLILENNLKGTFDSSRANTSLHFVNNEIQNNKTSPYKIVPSQFNPSDGPLIINTDKNITLCIFSRHGHRVFRSVDYQNDWDGKDNGKELNEGTYFYQVTSLNEDLVETGWIQLASQNVDISKNSEKAVRSLNNLITNSIEGIIPHSFTIKDQNSRLILNTDQNYGLQIYNRWGNQIYKSDLYQNDWDGTWEGNPLPEATYFVTLTQEKKVIETNWIRIIGSVETTRNAEKKASMSLIWPQVRNANNEVLFHLEYQWLDIKELPVSDANNVTAQFGSTQTVPKSREEVREFLADIQEINLIELFDQNNLPDQSETVRSVILRNNTFKNPRIFKNMRPALSKPGPTLNLGIKHNKGVSSFYGNYKLEQSAELYIHSLKGKKLFNTSLKSMNESNKSINDIGEGFLTHQVKKWPEGILVVSIVQNNTYYQFGILNK